MVAAKSLSSTVRAAGFSDAVLGIVATILVIPLTSISDQEIDKVFFDPSFSLQDGILTSDYMLANYAIFWGVFILIVATWVRHARAFDGLHGVDQLLVTVNWMELLAISLIPLFAAAAVFRPASSSSSSDGRHSVSASPYGPVKLLTLNILVIASVHLFFQTMAVCYREDRRTGILYVLCCQALLHQGELVASYIRTITMSFVHHAC